MQPFSAVFKARRSVKFLLLAIAAMLVAILVTFLLPRSPQADNATPISIAAAVPLSGRSASSGQEIVQSIQLYIDNVNKTGGINGHPVKLVTYDDKGEATVAQQVAQEIVKTPSLAVLGHGSSDGSYAAGGVYQESRLAAITGTANSEKVTADRPYYFRIVYTNSTVGSVLSIYAQQVLGFKTASIVYDKDSSSEQAQTEIIKSVFGKNGTVKRVLAIDTANKQQSIGQIINELAADPEPGILFMPLTKQDLAEEFLVALKRRGIKIPILGDQSISREAFAKRFEKYDEEKNNPGFFTNGIYIPSPILFDSAGADAQEFVNNYQKAYGKPPSFAGAKFYEAALVAVDALRKADLQLTPASLESDREKVRQKLADLNSTKVAVSGLTGPLFFNANRSSDQPVRVAQFQNYKLISAPQQFTTITNSEKLNLPKELQAGNIVQAGDKYFWRQRVVYTGLDINKLSRIDQNKSSFSTDFYLWFRYNGNDDPVDIEFPAAVTNSVNPIAPVYDAKNPIKSQTVDGLTYRLYQVRAEFKNTFDFRDYPFDLQKLVIRFDNHRLSSDRLVYVIDTFGLKLPKPEAAQRKPFQGLQLWNFKDLAYFQDTSRSTSTQGDPELFQSNAQVDYPGFSVSMTLQRKTLVFLTKNLLPLLLLTGVSYCALFFPYNMFVPRTMAPASALLSGIVLLLSFNNQLPEISYTVALEYVFYTYFLLCLIPIVVTMIGAKLEKEGKKQAFKYLNIASWILFPAIVIGVASTYVINYGSRLF